MNLVIFGESRCGKSTLTNMLQREIGGVRKITLDLVIMAFEKVFPELNINFSRSETSQKQLSAFIKEYFEILINTKNKSEHHVVEGGGLSDECLLALNQNENVKVVCVGKTLISPEEFFDEIRKYEKNLETYGWTKRLDDQKLLKWCAGWIAQSKRNKEFCQNNNITFIDTSYNQMEVLGEFVENVKQNINNL